MSADCICEKLLNNEKKLCQEEIVYGLQKWILPKKSEKSQRYNIIYVTCYHCDATKLSQGLDKLTHMSGSTADRFCQQSSVHWKTIQLLGTYTAKSA